MKKTTRLFLDILKVAVGCALFGVGLSVFLIPGGLNAGGISGLAMVLQRLLRNTPISKISVGTITLLVNLPLFIIGGYRVGRRFFIGSLLGMALSSVAIDLCAMIPAPKNLDPLMCAIYGGVICGVGLGMVFTTGSSTGGSDIIVRLLKLRWQHVPIGVINTCFDMCVALLTGIAFKNINLTLYSGITIFLCGKVIDAVVYSFDFTKVALIITKQHEPVVEAISTKLDRGATYLNGQGSYSQKEMKIVLSVVKKQQVAELKRLVMEIDPDAFVVVQEAHQVLGEGFSRYSRDSL